MVCLGFTSEGGYETAAAFLAGTVMIPRIRRLGTADIASQWRPRNRPQARRFKARTPGYNLPPLLWHHVHGSKNNGDGNR